MLPAGGGPPRTTWKSSSSPEFHLSGEELAISQASPLLANVHRGGMMSSIRPTGVTANRQNREVEITWNDGHRSVYSFSLLRHACPCAQCRGGHEHMSAEPDPQVFSQAEEDTPATRLAGLEGAGQYGLSPAWEDGHQYGIYTWSYLRALCPCDACRNAG